MIKILHITGALNKGGTETFIMNVFRNIDRKEVMFDFLLGYKAADGYEEEARALGATINYFSPRRKGFLKYARSLKDFFKKHASEYQAVHYSGNLFSELLPLTLAKKYGIPIRIIHTHSRSGRGHNKLLHLLNRKRIYGVATDFFACSQPGKVWGYSGSKAFDEAVVIPNGIDLGRFSFSPEIRKHARERLHLKDEFTICHVGGFREVKNHTFMLEVLKEVCKTDPGARMILVGDGHLKSHIEHLSAEMGLTGNIIFLGNRDDIPEILCASDVFLFPSKYEGLGIVAVEAQASGLPVVASDRVPKEVAVTPNVEFLSLESPASQWAGELLKYKGFSRSVDKEQLKPYDITQTCRLLMQVYKRGIRPTEGS